MLSSGNLANILSKIRRHCYGLEIPASLWRRCEFGKFSDVELGVFGIKTQASAPRNFIVNSRR